MLLRPRCCPSGALWETIGTRFSPPRLSPPLTPCALLRSCAAPAGIRRSVTSTSRDARRLRRRRGPASPRCPPKDAWRPARGRRCGWGASQKLCTSSVTTCRQTTAREDNPWPRYRLSNTQLNTSTSFQTSWAARNGRKNGPLLQIRWPAIWTFHGIFVHVWWVLQHLYFYYSVLVNISLASWTFFDVNTVLNYFVYEAAFAGITKSRFGSRVCCLLIAYLNILIMAYWWIKNTFTLLMNSCIYQYFHVCITRIWRIRIVVVDSVLIFNLNIVLYLRVLRQ